MTSNELRIGNYFQWSTFASMGIGVDRITHGQQIMDYINLKEPVPLTAEWLLQFGFIDEGKAETKHHSNFFSRYIDDYKYCFAYANFRDDWGFYQEYTDSPFEHDEGKKYIVSCGIKYVHQLQNIYFALTGKELQLTSEKKPTN